MYAKFGFEIMASVDIPGGAFNAMLRAVEHPEM